MMLFLKLVLYVLLVNFVGAFPQCSSPLLTPIHSASIFNKRNSFFGRCRERKVGYHRRAAVSAQLNNVPQETVELLQITSKGIEGLYDSQERSKIQELIQRLETRGSEKLYLSKPSINDYYRVNYVIEGKGPNAGTPVGGGFRYGIGRAFFRTEDTFQHIVNGTAINMLYFTLLGCIKGCVILRGDIEPMTTAERQSLMLRWCSATSLLNFQTFSWCVNVPHSSFRFLYPTRGVFWRPPCPPDI